MRSASMVRKTSEVDLKIGVNLDGMGRLKGRTGIKFLDHLFELLVKHSHLDVEIKVRGDLKHHLIEDLALTLGEGIGKALGDKRGIRRFGHAYVSMDDSLARAVIDLGGRSFSVIDLGAIGLEVENLKIEDVKHFIKSLSDGSRCNLHVEVLYGSNDHHKIEAAIKALALSLRDAIKVEGGGIPSTKGIV